jgi:hypothetical protein
MLNMGGIFAGPVQIKKFLQLFSAEKTPTLSANSSKEQKSAQEHFLGCFL